MILIHLIQALITKSKDLLIAFESFLSSSTFPPAQHLAETWNSFSTAFTSWKARDSEILINTMVAQYAGLDLIWQKVKDETEEHVAADFKEGIRENQLMLLVRIRRLAGENTRVLIRQAVKEARRTRLPKKEKGDTRPRETPSSSEANSVSTAVESATVAPPPPTTREPTTLSELSSDAQRQQTARVFSQFESGGTPGNREIVHELALDRTFRLTPRKKGGFEQMVEREARRAFWDTMREDVLLRGELAKWIPGMAESVKGKLLHLLDPNGSLHRMISDSIDTTIIEQQCRAGSYDYEKFFSFVLGFLPKICSPARDADVQALVSDTGDYIQRLQRLFDVLELLQLDHANFLLMMSAQYVIPEAIPYERRLFTADLEAARTTLTRTTTWLLNAKQEKLAEAAANQPSHIPSATEIYNHAFSTLIMTLDTSPITAQAAPETLHLDIDRINTFRKEFRHIVLGTAICLTTKNLLRRDVRSAWKPLKERVAALLSALPPSPSPADTKLLAEAVCSFLTETVACPKPVLAHVASAVTRIAGRRPGHDSADQDPVVRIVAKRVYGFVAARLDAQGSKEKVRLATGGGDTLTGFGMAEWIADVGVYVERAGTCAGWNRECYSGWYDVVLGV